MNNVTRDNPSQWEGARITNRLGIEPHTDFDDSDLWVISGREDYGAAMGSREDLLALARAIIRNLGGQEVNVEVEDREERISEDDLALIALYRIYCESTEFTSWLPHPAERAEGLARLLEAEPYITGPVMLHEHEFEGLPALRELAQDAELDIDAIRAFLIGRRADY